MPSSPVADHRARTGRHARSVTAVSLAQGKLLALILAVGFVVIGCGNGPPPRLYVLESAEVPLAGPATETVFDALGISSITLPGYARDARVATRDADRRVRIDDSLRWAEDPDEAITRSFAARLRQHAGGVVLVEPWPRDFAPAARIEIDFDRLLREPSGGVDSAGQVRLLSGDGRTVLDVLSFRIERAAEGGDPSAWFGAVAALLDDLARTAVDALEERLGSRPAT